MRIAICNNRKENHILRDMLSVSEPLKGVEYAITFFEKKEELLGAFLENPNCFDIVLLNPALGGKNSPRAAHHIRMVNVDCAIILTAHNDDFAMAGYSVFATGYLVQPYSQAHMISGSLKVLQHKYLVQPYSQAQLDFFLSRAISICGRCQSEGMFYVKENQEYVGVSEADLVFVESDLKYLILHISDGSIVRTLMPLEKLYEKLRGEQFLVSHKSFLVNMDYVTCVSPYEFTLGSFGTAAITQRRYPQIRDTYFSYSRRRADELSGICNY